MVSIARDNHRHLARSPDRPGHGSLMAMVHALGGRILAFFLDCGDFFSPVHLSAARGSRSVESTVRNDGLHAPDYLECDAFATWRWWR